MKQNVPTILLAVSALFISVTVSTSAETDWFETDGGNIRIIMEPIKPNQSFVRGVIDIDLLDGWKTYWVDPGSGGIAPSLQPVDSVNFTVEGLFFPVPTNIKSEYGDHAGYVKSVQIPFIVNSIEPLVPREINARVMVGICEEICIPAFADFELPVTIASETTRAMIAVQSAFDALPKSPEDIGLSVTIRQLQDQQIEVTVDGPQDGLELFAAGAKSEQFKAPIKLSRSPDNSVFTFEPIMPFDVGQKIEFLTTGRTSNGEFVSSNAVVF